jgi:NAD kinase/nicotinic acid mononucleotide adenylyltransferase
MSRTIAVYGGSFSPPSLYHRAVAEELARQFDTVVVVPCGPRPDKPSNNQVDPVYRAAMADMAFRGIANVEVELFDLEQATFTRTHELQRLIAKKLAERAGGDGGDATGGQVWHVVSAEMVARGGGAESVIHCAWQQGPALWRELNFAVVQRPGDRLDPADLPPRHRVVRVGVDGCDASLREGLFNGEAVSNLLSAPVAAYVERHGLYRGGVPVRMTRLKLDQPRLLIETADRNEKAALWRRQFERFECPADRAGEANGVLVLGGDGSMLHAIQKHWRRRIPFFGVNAGHLGFLLNNADEVLGEGQFPPPELLLRQMPLLYVEFEKPDGSVVADLTFNDAWVERSTGQSAWLEVKVDGNVRLPKLVCDGALLSTAAGSTAYARSMGATPLLADTPAWLLVGSNVMTPPTWQSALLSCDSQVEVRSLDKIRKRPLNGYLYGVLMGEVVAMRARVSRIASVELAFYPRHDMAEKIAQLQFPQGAA